MAEAPLDRSPFERGQLPLEWIGACDGRSLGSRSVIHAGAEMGVQTGFDFEHQKQKGHGLVLGRAGSHDGVSYGEIFGVRGHDGSGVLERAVLVA